MKIKICCISSVEEADLAISLGADAIGLVSNMPSGPGVINESEIAKISQSVPKNIHTFLLTSKQDSKEIIDQLKFCKTNTIQIVDKLLIGSYSDIKNELPDVTIVQVIHVNGDDSILEAKNIAQNVDVILLDSGNQNKEIKELGGTGRTHDWTLSKRIVESVDIPVYLAGGLNPNNVKEAINLVNPFGVDICSGVRTNNKLDANKLSAFISIIRSMK